MKSAKSILKICGVLCATAVFGYAGFHYANQGQASIDHSAKKGSSENTEVEERDKNAPRPNEDGKERSAEETARALNGLDASLKYEAIFKLRGQGDADAVKQLSSLLGDQDPELVAQSLDAIAYIAQNGGGGEALKKQIYQLLEKQAGDKDFPQRGRALVLAAIVGKESILPEISGYLDEDEPGARDAASRALSLISTPACLPYLEKLLTMSEDPLIRQNAYSTMAVIGSTESLAALAEHMNASTGTDQAIAASMMARLNKPECNKILSEAIENKTLGKDAIEQIAATPAAPNVIGSLVSSDAVDPELKLSLLRSIANSTPYASADVRKSVADAMASALNSTSSDLQIQAIRTIGKIGDPNIADALTPFLESSDAKVRQEAFASIVPHASPSNYKMILDFLWSDDLKTRRVAMLAAERFISSDDRAVLERAARSDDEFVRQHAEQLLSRLN